MAVYNLIGLEGNIANGTSFGTNLNVFPLPTASLSANQI
jgi:hypothetical protein